MNSTQYIIESCDMQGDSAPEAYIGMARAYQLLVSDHRWREYPWIMVDEMARLIDPRNTNGFRTGPAVFMSGREAVKPEHILRRMKQFWDFFDSSWAPLEMYKTFEEIHPYIDGNGRLGSLLYNYLNKTLDDPVHPLDIWKEN